MKRSNLIGASKKIMAGCLAVTMVLTGIVIVPKTAEATTETTKSVHFASVSDYKMNDYWDGKDNKAPVKEGYVFGGWYNADGTPLKNPTAADDTAIAKFVPAEVLSIKTQVGTSEANGETITSLRILSTVDSTNYQEVGFEYKLAASDTKWTSGITKVYSAIRPYKGAPDTALKNPGVEFVSGASNYFIAADVSKIGSGSFAKIVYARPFWITLDGTKVMGLARNSRVEDKDADKDYESVGINLLPQLSEGNLASVAAGKIQVTYNTTNYDVVGTPDITAGATGGTYLFPEMECHVDETTGTITFVGNADIKDGSLTNLTADGLFANVRFVKAANATGDALDFTIKSEETDFCNWAEESVTEVVVQ